MVNAKPIQFGDSSEMSSDNFFNSKAGSHIVIIGNGVAGNTVSSVIRKFDKEAEITIISEEIFPEYSACLLANYLCGEINKKMIFLKEFEDYKQEGINTIFGQKVTGVDIENKKVPLESQNIFYDKLVIATGSKSQIPPIEGVNKKGVFTFKTLADAEGISSYSGKRVVVVGSGPVGVEASIALRKMGLQVFLIELLERILPTLFDERPSSILRSIIESHGIKVFTGEKVIRILGKEAAQGVLTDRREIECDMVILVAGMKPNVELAQRMGLNIGNLGGIKVNKQMLTNIDNVYACGDCVESIDMFSGRDTLSLLWHNAKLQGEVVGFNCVGLEKVYLGSLNITGLDIFGTHVVSFGETTTKLLDYDNESRIIEKTYDDRFYRLIILRERLVGAQGIGRTEEMGLLLSLLQKGKDIGKLQEFMRSKKLLEINPWSYRVKRFLN